MQKLIEVAALQATSDIKNGIRKNPYKKGTPMFIAYEKVFEIVNESDQNIDFVKAK